MSSSYNSPPPVMPGEELRKLSAGLGLKQDELASALGISRVRLNAVLNGRRAITAETALKLAEVLDTSPEFWLRLQMVVDLHRARERIRPEELAALPKLRTSQPIRIKA